MTRSTAWPRDALEHPVFREFRRVDTEWQHSSRTVPFSAFFLNHTAAESDSATVGDDENTPPEAIPPPRSLLAIHAKPGGASELHRLVPPRIPEHHRRQMLLQAPGKSTFGRVPKPQPAGLFQPPKPEMVQAKLPPISLRPLRRPD
jgi:hypothetical protein